MGNMSSAYWNDKQWHDHFVRILPNLISAKECPITYCIDPACPDTNWGGIDRVHYRQKSCPAYTFASANDIEDRIEAINDHLMRELYDEVQETKLIHYYADKIMRALNA